VQLVESIADLDECGCRVAADQQVHAKAHGVTVRAPSVARYGLEPVGSVPKTYRSPQSPETNPPHGFALGAVLMADVDSAGDTEHAVVVRAAAVLMALARTSAWAAAGTVVATFRPFETAAYVMTRATEGDGSGSDPWVLNDRYVNSRFSPSYVGEPARGA
jgi:hypothetical protein